MPSLQTPQDLLINELKEIHSAESQLSEVLPRLVKRVSSDRLREMLEVRQAQGAELIEELDELFDEMDVADEQVKNVAAEGLIEDTFAHLDQAEEESLADPLLLASTQKLEHYCIAAWGTAAAMGRLMEQPKVVQVMEKVLRDGKKFDEDMTRLAEEEVNPLMLVELEEDELDAEAEGEEEPPTPKPKKPH